MPEQPDRDAWETEREAFAGELLDLLPRPEAMVFFGGEAGCERAPRARSQWVKQGSRPTQGYFGGRARQNVVGAVNPATGQFVSLIVPAL